MYKKLQFRTILLTYKKCVAEKRTYANKSLFANGIVVNNHLINYPEPRDNHHMAEATSCLHEVLHSLDTTICQSYHSNSFVDLLQLQGKFDFFSRNVP